MATNYVEDDAGKFIPASRRADGTWRKPRRVKEGYVPPEEVPVYENKYVKFFKSKPSLPPGLSAAAANELKQESQQRQDGDQSGSATLSKTAKKNLRRKEKRQQQQQEEEEEAHDSSSARVEESNLAHDGDAAALSEALRRSSITERGGGKPSAECKAVAPASPEEADPAGSLDLGKRIKNLKKKLRQIEELEQKIQSGELLQPSREQQEKLARKSALEQELSLLE